MDFLIRTTQSKTFNFETENYAKTSIVNFTRNNLEIPENITKMLELGLKNAIGGIGNKNQILHKNEILFTHWLEYAQKSNLSTFKIAEIRALLTLEMQKLKNCNTPNLDSKAIRQFLDHNKNVVFVEIDKSKNLALVDLDDYCHKLIQVFNPEKFEKLSRNPCEVDITNFYKLINKMKKFITIDEFRQIKPFHSIKKGHGILKVHKPGMPMRPIINSRFSITSGSEKYILKLIQPLIKKCEYSLNSTLAFNEKFKKIIPKFTNFYEVVSFDATSLFTSINVPRVVDYIIGKIYENPDIFFGEDNLDNFPPQLILKEFMLGVLLKFSAFTTLNGFYRQTEGLAMGSKLSPAISNIFLHMLESTTITELLDQKIFSFY